MLMNESHYLDVSLNFRNWLIAWGVIPSMRAARA
jgi:hypothetical protein